MDLTSIICPTCFEEFHVAEPPSSEVPAEVDYDCEVCCRPMVIHYWEEAGEVVGNAVGMDA